jgi:hypothetical protein
VLLQARARRVAASAWIRGEEARLATLHAVHERMVQLGVWSTDRYAVVARVASAVWTTMSDAVASVAESHEWCGSIAALCITTYTHASTAAAACRVWSIGMLAATWACMSWLWCASLVSMGVGGTADHAANGAAQTDDGAGMHSSMHSRPRWSQRWYDALSAAAASADRTRRHATTCLAAMCVHSYADVCQSAAGGRKVVAAAAAAAGRAFGATKAATAAAAAECGRSIVCAQVVVCCRGGYEPVCQGCSELNLSRHLACLPHIGGGVNPDAYTAMDDDKAALQADEDGAGGSAEDEEAGPPA